MFKRQLPSKVLELSLRNIAYLFSGVLSVRLFQIIFSVDSPNGFDSSNILLQIIVYYLVGLAIVESYRSRG